MTVRGLVTRFTFSVAGMLALASLSVSRAHAADEHDHGGLTPDSLVKLVRQMTEPYKNVAAAEAAGYALAFGCVSGPDAGAMGLHYVNMPLVLDGEIDREAPEIVITSRPATARCASSAPTTSCWRTRGTRSTRRRRS